MEWHGDYVRQKPGPKNIGINKILVSQFECDLFTLLQRVYSIEDRAFSHGCIRVEKPVELATQILKKYKKWDERKIREAMVGKKNGIHYKIKSCLHWLFYRLGR
jgi:murein L,D-transpeptidase YcbB/YkuD